MSSTTERTRGVDSGVLPISNIREIYARNFPGQNGDGTSFDINKLAYNYYKQ